MLRVARRSLPLAIAAALALAAPAFAVPPPLGALTPFPGAAGCFNSAGTSGCTAYEPQGAGFDVVVSGTTLYASAGSALMAYRRNADGSLTPLNCVAASMLAACATTDAEIVSAKRLAVSAAAKALYVAVGDTAATSRILAFRLAADGGIGARIGCLSEIASSGCVDVKALSRPRDLALSADGRKLYTAAEDTTVGGLAAFDVAADGTFPAMQPTDCVGPDGSLIAGCPPNDLTLAFAVDVRGPRLYVAWRGLLQSKSGIEVYTLGTDGSIGAKTGCVGLNIVNPPSCATEWDGLAYPGDVLVAPDGRSLSVGTGSETITTLALDPTGAIGTRLSCETRFATAGCTTHAGLGVVNGLALSPDGRTLYAAAYSSGIWGFGRDPLTGATTGGFSCIAGGVVGCTTFAGIANAFGVAVAPDGARVYGNSQATGGLSVFQREVGPSCLPTSATVAPPATSVMLSVSCSDANGDPITYELVAAPAHGTATVSPAGSATYTPTPGFAGTDGFTFRATDGSVASSPANVVVGVVPPAAPGGGTPVPPVAPPRSTIDRIASPIRASKLTRFTGRATGALLKRVEIAVFRLDNGARAAKSRPRPACRRLRPSGRIGRAVRASAPCIAAGFLAASGTARWTFNLVRPLPRGRYVIVSRAFGAAGAEKSYTAAARNRRVFTVR